MQQINLFHAQFKPKTVILPARQLLLLILLTMIILAVISLYSYQQNRVLQQAIAIAPQQYPAQKMVNEDLERTLLIAELLKIQKQQQDKKNLLAYLTDQNFGNQHGFSGTLMTLSQQVINKVWLTEFSLVDGGQVITLHGHTTQISQIPVYIDSLAKSKRFHGQQFSALQLEQPKQEGDFYTFQLNTGAGNR
jgi:hypothetical protein